ncbi:armadillo-type protein [Infundibulicybe gibba]|nr:armadillo-type protein [Infundibulicybe gibba]
MVSSGGGARGVINDPKFETLFNLLGDKNSDAGVKIATCNVLAELVAPRGLFSDHPKFNTLFNLLNDNSGNAGVTIAARNVIILVALRGYGHHPTRMIDVETSQLFDLLKDKSTSAGVKIAACRFIRANRRSSFTPESDTRRRTTLYNLLDDKNCDASVKIAACNAIAGVGLYHVTHPNLESLFTILDDENNGTGMKIAACNVLLAIARQNCYNPGFMIATSTPQLNTLFNLLDDKHSDIGVKITTCGILAELAHKGYIFGDHVTAPVIYRLIVDPNVKLQIAGLKTLSGFRHGSIPPKVLATIHGLVMSMLMNRTEKDRLSATLALCSCIHERMDSARSLQVHGGH